MPSTGIGLVCDPRGIITEVLGDTLPGAHMLAVGQSFAAAVHGSSRQKAMGFIRRLSLERAVFDVELTVKISGRLVALRFCGGAADDRLLLTGTLAEDKSRYNVLTQIQNEQAGMLRAALKAASWKRYRQAGGEEDLWDQITHLRGKLAGAQRELAKKREELDRTKAEVASLTVVDALTNVLNRRAFLINAEREVLSSIRYGRDLSAILMDVYRLGAINQAHGRAAGDQVLCVVAARCDRAIRSVDILGRYGGDELVILLPETDEEGSRAVADRLGRLISAAPVDIDGAAIPVIMNMAVSEIRRGDTGIAALLARAERALSMARESVRGGPWGAEPPVLIVS
jgi:diguanylate cyclase (GGDEF)-like protein